MGVSEYWALGGRLVIALTAKAFFEENYGVELSQLKVLSYYTLHRRIHCVRASQSLSASLRQNVPRRDVPSAGRRCRALAFGHPPWLLAKSLSCRLLPASQHAADAMPKMPRCSQLRAQGDRVRPEHGLHVP